MASSDKSNIPPLKSPEFKSTVPQYMLDSIDNDADRYMVEQMSVMTQQSSWQTHKLLNIYDYTRSINGKVVELEQFRNDLLSQLKVEDNIAKENTKHTRNYRLASVVFIAVVYPLYLAAASQTGLFDVVKKLLFVIP